MCIRARAGVDRFEALVLELVGPDLVVEANAATLLAHVEEDALSLIGDGLEPIIGLGKTVGAGVLLVASAVASSVTDNIPLAAMLAKILGGLGLASDSPFWWAVIFGANLGGNLTPIGSASTLVAVTIMHKHQLPMSFVGFVKKAAPYALVQLILATAYVLLFLR